VMVAVMVAVETEEGEAATAAARRLVTEAREPLRLRQAAVMLEEDRQGAAILGEAIPAEHQQGAVAMSEAARPAAAIQEGGRAAGIRAAVLPEVPGIQVAVLPGAPAIPRGRVVAEAAESPESVSLERLGMRWLRGRQTLLMQVLMRWRLTWDPVRSKAYQRRKQRHQKRCLIRGLFPQP
jgi:hypothetical protein